MMRSPLHMICGVLWIALCAGCARFDAVRSPYNVGVYLESQGDFVGASQEYRRALEDDPNDEAAQFNLAFALDRMSSGDFALSDARRVEARELYRDLATRNPPHLRAMINGAALDIEAGEIALGFQSLEAASAAWPKSPAPWLAALAHRLAGRMPEGEGYAWAQSPLGVLADEALSRAEASPLAHLMCAQVDELAGEFSAAEEHYRLGLELAPSDLDLLTGLGALSMTRARRERDAGDLSAAQNALREALLHFKAVWAIAPESRRAHLALAIGYEEAAALERIAGEGAESADHREEQSALERALAHRYAARERGSPEPEAWSAFRPEDSDHEAALARIYARLAALASGGH